MMETANTRTPTHRMLAVIERGVNFKACAQSLPKAPKPKLLDQVREAIRTRHYSDRTEKA